MKSLADLMNRKESTHKYWELTYLCGGFTFKSPSQYFKHSKRFGLLKLVSFCSAEN